MGIPKTYPDGNLEDRDWIGDVWTWLQTQPQTAWLYFARDANWDDMDWLFPQIVMHPDCDRALASWLFWHAQPNYYFSVGKRPLVDGSGGDDLMAMLLERAEAGGWPARGLHYARAEVAEYAFDTAAQLAEGNSAPFAIPRQLCASFDGRNPPLEMDAQTDADWQELTDTQIDVRIMRRDEDAMRDYSWYESALRLPDNPVVTAGMSDLEAIEAVFGEHRASQARIEEARKDAQRGWRTAAAAAQTGPATNRAGMTTDPERRSFGFALLGISAVLLLLILWATGSITR